MHTVETGERMSEARAEPAERPVHHMGMGGKCREKCEQKGGKAEMKQGLAHVSIHG